MVDNVGTVDCLLIGAMKSGTTSLMTDMALHPRVYVPAVKEPHFLAMRDVSSEKISALYSSLFIRAKKGQIRCDGSTGYSKRPTVEGVAERAMKIAGPAVKILYIVRDPVQRALSHHYHLAREGRAPWDFADAIQSCPEIIQYGRYAWQLEPWVEAYGIGRICVVRFEDYLGDRPTVLSRVFAFLGVEQLSDYGSAPVENVGHEMRVARPLIRKVIGNFSHLPFYKLYIRPYLPRLLRHVYSSMVRTPSPERPSPPSPASLADLRRSFTDDVYELRSLLHLSEPLWDMGG